MEKTYRVTGTALATLIIRGTVFKAKGYVDTLMNEKEYIAFRDFIEIEQCDEIKDAEVIKSEPVLEKSEPIIDEQKDSIVKEENEQPKEIKTNGVQKSKKASSGKNKN